LFNSFFASPTQNFPFFNLWPSLVPRLTPAPQIRRVSRQQYCVLYKFIYLLTYLLVLQKYQSSYYPHTISSLNYYQLQIMDQYIYPQTGTSRLMLHPFGIGKPSTSLPGWCWS